MFKALVRSFFSIVRSPLLLLPALVAVLVSLAALLLVQESVLTILAELMNGSLSEFESLFFLVSSFATEFFWILVLVFVTVLANSWLSLSMARFARLQEEKKMNVLGAVGYAIKKLPLLMAWSVFVLLIAFLLLAVLMAVSAIGFWNQWIGLLLLIVWVVCSLLVFFVFSFTIPVAGLEDASIKNALQKASLLVRKHFFSVFAFMLVLGFFVGIVSWIGGAISDAVDDDTLAVIVLAVFLLIQNVIANLALPFYYLEKKPVS
jgi:hypothetical protein